MILSRLNLKKNDGENWLVFIFNPEAKNLMIEFDFSINQIVHEFQLAFNYKGIKERNRFLIIENTKVLFDCIKKGSFSLYYLKNPLIIYLVLILLIT